MKSKQSQKKEQVSKRIDALDPNNNKNIVNAQILKRRGKKVSDDHFEHRSSNEISPSVPGATKVSA